MSQRSKAIETLSEYFETKGGILSIREYKAQTDTPIRLEQVKRVFGNWSRMEKIVRAVDIRNHNKPAPMHNGDEIMAEQYAKQAEHEELIRSIGEDIEQKTAREAAARDQTIADALNAATPEGARENKMRKGGIESVDAKVIKESLARAVAEEHAMLAKTAAGAAEGKELLGGVEDQDAKNMAIARQNERTERSAMLAATAEGSALAKLEEDDSDGHLTREAQARLRNELRPYVAPTTDENIGEFVAQEGAKLRDETKAALASIESDDNMTMGAAVRGELARDNAGATDVSSATDLSKAPPADQEPDADFLGGNDPKKTGIQTLDDKTSTTEKPKLPVNETANARAAGAEDLGKAEENKDTVNKKENQANPETPPADRNPDPKFQVTAGDKPEAKKTTAKS